MLRASETLPPHFHMELSVILVFQMRKLRLKGLETHSRLYSKKEKSRLQTCADGTTAQCSPNPACALAPNRGTFPEELIRLSSQILCVSCGAREFRVLKGRPLLSVTSVLLVMESSH